MTTNFLLYLLLLSNTLPLVVHAFLGTFSRLYNDDFCFYVQVKLKGFFGAFIYYFNVATGRYSDLAMELGTINLNNNLIFGTGTFIFVWLIILFFVINLFLNREKNYYFYSFLLAVTIIYVSIDLLPDKSFRRVIDDISHTWDRYPAFYEVLYWKAGRNRFISPLILGSCLVGIIFLLFRHSYNYKKINALTILGCFVAFIAGGFGETYVGLQMILLTIVLIVLTYFKGNQKKIMLIKRIGLIWLVTLFSIIVYIKAPGTENRMGIFKQPSDLVELIVILVNSIKSTLFIIFKWPGNIISLFSVVFISFFVGMQIKIQEMSTKKNKLFIKYIPFAILIIVIGAFFPAVYAISKGPPPRVLVFPIYIILCLLSIWSFFIGNVIDKKKIDTASQWLNPILVLLFFSFSVNGLRDAEKLFSLRHDFKSYAHAYDKREKLIENAKNKNLKSLSVTELHHFIGGKELSSDSTFYVNECMCDYYGINLKLD